MRNSPSGPLTVTDEVTAVIPYDQTSSPAAPGDFFVALVASIAGALVPVADPLAAEAALIAGAKTRSGRVLRARIALIANQDTSGNGDIDFQWTVNGAPVGNVVTLKWADGAFFPDISVITPQQVIDNGHGTEVDFGEPAWGPGDFVILKAVVKGPIFPASKAFILFSFENSYER